MDIKRIIWSDNAKNELKKILSFYNERNGSKKYSLKILNEIDELLKTLSKSEFIGRMTSLIRKHV
ncbi:MAG: type II toxin-antitoxin system RelE/ParE family toxin [Polaribacter sp.]|nr:type II toxin-antitoxin system RelE/ParE family toxin [Polaribacter sp.]